MKLPESESEFDEVMRACTNFLNNQIVERINQYSNDFYTELNKAYSRRVNDLCSGRDREVLLPSMQNGVPVGKQRR